MPPFQAETALALALKQVRETPRSMLVHRPDLPPELDRLVLKLMAKSPADRYQSAAEMLADLTKLRDVLQVGSAPTITDAGPANGEDAAVVSRAAERRPLRAARPLRRPTAERDQPVRPAWARLPPAVSRG